MYMYHSRFENWVIFHARNKPMIDIKQWLIIGEDQVRNDKAFSYLNGPAILPY